MAKTKYIIVEKFSASPYALNYWVASSMESARKHLKALFNVELLCAKTLGRPLPIDCTDMNFFYVTRSDGKEIRYTIDTAKAV